MSEAQVFTVFQQAIWTAILVGGPIIGVCTLIGLLISIVQAATQVQEGSLTFAPKLLAIAAILVIAGPWMLDQLLAFTRYIFALAAGMG
jgi:flagellar biosynthesis protein FliQ